MLLSVVSVLVVAQSSSEIPEGLKNNPVLSVRQEVRNYSVTYPQILNDHPKSLRNPYFKEQIPVVGLSGIIPQI